MSWRGHRASVAWGWLHCNDKFCGVWDRVGVLLFLWVTDKFQHINRTHFPWQTQVKMKIRMLLKCGGNWFNFYSLLYWYWHSPREGTAVDCWVFQWHGTGSRESPLSWRCFEVFLDSGSIFFTAKIWMGLDHLWIGGDVTVSISVGVLHDLAVDKLRYIPTSP